MPVDGKLIVDPKVVAGFNEAHVAQMIEYLTITGLELAILLNFKSARLEWKCVVRQQKAPARHPSTFKKSAAIRDIRVIGGSKRANCGSKKIKKKLVRPSRLPLEENFERQMPSFGRSKKIQKSEKKACQGLRNLISLPKPNQTNGETND